jgi:hypothetical protein
MSTKSAPDKQSIAPRLPHDCPKSLPQSMKWEGRIIPLEMHGGGWRARCRTKAFSCNISTGTASLPEAKRIVKAALDERKEASPIAQQDTKSLQFLADAYLAAPKRSSDSIAKRNVCRLKSVVRDGAGTDLAGFQIANLPALWPAYVAKRQGLDRPDYATRRGINRGINSAMRQAACLLTKALEPHYLREGIVLPPHAGRILLAAEAPKVPAEADDPALIEAWHGLRETDLPMWLTVGLARFAGLRQSEILAFRGKWIVRKGDATYVRLQDRPEDGFQTKTGIPYSALVMEPELAEYLREMDAEAVAVALVNTVKWIGRKPQAWLKPFTGAALSPLHRLRGLYADHVKRDTEQAILARQAGIKAASEALGHTTIGTTVDHYLGPDS